MEGFGIWVIAFVALVLLWFILYFIPIGLWFRPSYREYASVCCNWC